MNRKYEGTPSAQHCPGRWGAARDNTRTPNTGAGVNCHFAKRGAASFDRDQVSARFVPSARAPTSAVPTIGTCSQQVGEGTFRASLTSRVRLRPRPVIHPSQPLCPRPMCGTRLSNAFFLCPSLKTRRSSETHGSMVSCCLIPGAGRKSDPAPGTSRRQSGDTGGSSCCGVGNATKHVPGSQIRALGDPSRSHRHSGQSQWLDGICREVANGSCELRNAVAWGSAESGVIHR